jgi:hypothetical protein
MDVQCSIVLGIALCRVASPHHFNAECGSTFHVHADPGSDPVPDPIPHESDANGDHWSADPPGLNCVRRRPSTAQFEPLNP